jgi:hypothetical protein
MGADQSYEDSNRESRAKMKVCEEAEDVTMAEREIVDQLENLRRRRLRLRQAGRNPNPTAMAKRGSAGAYHSAHCGDAASRESVAECDGDVRYFLH